MRVRLARVEALLQDTRAGTEGTGAGAVADAREEDELTEAPLTPSLTIAASSGDDDGVGILPPEEETETPEFATMARKLTGDISRHLKINPGFSRRREPEPPEFLAWQYVNAYFDESRDVAFGILSRPGFECRLRTHFENSPTTPLEEDASWYALRNVVYAAGCRQIMARERSGPLLLGQGYGWQYFQNALSVHTDLLYARSSLMAIQALAIMAFFVESIGTPALDYMLSLNAMKLAESKGLHRQAAATWNLGESALQTRSYIWWSVYGLERFNAFRWGRPLSIEDRAITCELPSKVVDGSMVNLGLLVPAVKHAQILADITEQFTALKASTPTLNEVIRTVDHLEKMLRDWHDSLPPNLRTGTNYSETPEDMDLVHVLYYHYVFWGTLITIHSILVHPWNVPKIQTKPIELLNFRRHSQNSTRKVVDASRAMIRTLSHVSIDICSPKWLVFTYPLTAFMNLFIYILRYPRLPTVESDLDAMYRVCGHFNYMEYTLPEIAFVFPREATNLARFAVTKASENANRNSGGGKSSQAEWQTTRAMSTSELELPDFEVPPLYHKSATDTLELGIENWDTFLSWPE
ncbi:putative fungal specific transcription protein [Cladophialophora carrionii]|uniref:Putative fungal specific transcription protein n=1 Tax=Cladophialophora carrionii TaxID=86049 RepID=A0A1C1CAE0_9EURO|nr:putative fungal specific transcription protein [Cladophialophora carrionii]